MLFLDLVTWCHAVAP